MENYILPWWGANKTYLSHIGQYLMGAKLFNGTIYTRNNVIINVKLNTFESCKIAWFPWQPIMQFLRMGGGYLHVQNTRI